ncbi:hypothetical protein [Flagellimonas allohymeniacidonis]|uniref:Uncharacterized protein n=1 Tax=Flagellimonas allohymeniacidonis TaxID=2517819 RepID=A0A4Q8QJB4_9FLAO|nr:hypothetical protein [Allomuricauda hymeniacidonis]TAI48823.1 hypothetical protein EW142_03220 [Allomuricauda hymeniacidonis]
MYHELAYVQKCLEQIETQLGWGASDSWHNDMFVELSERIQQETKVLLSPVTLKRVWGRIDYKSAPSITTLNTLAKFAGFENWRDFKGNLPEKKSSGITRKIRANLGVIMMSASVMTLVFISFYSLRGPSQVEEPIDVSKVVFNSRPIAKGLPNSVVFDLDLGEIKSDSIHIQQYWDPTKTIDLQPGQKQATGQYYFPGYFRAKLLVDGKAIKQHDLFIKTQGWLGTLDYRPIPKYLKSQEVYEGNLAFPKRAIEEIEASEKPIRSTFHRVMDFETISGDNFELRSTLKNTYRDKWAVCQMAYIIVLGTKGAMVIALGIPGCASELWVMMNDVYLDGKEKDLSGLGIDLSEPKEIKVLVKEKKLTVSFANQTLFAGSYNETIGRIAGLRYRFLGTGEVHQSILSDLDGETVIDFMDDDAL